MVKRRQLLDESTVYKHHADGPRPVGTIGWDSNSGRLWGTLSEQIRIAGEEGGKRFCENRLYGISSFEEE
jgi:hypothetical protein